MDCKMDAVEGRKGREEGRLMRVIDVVPNLGRVRFDEVAKE